MHLHYLTTHSSEIIEGLKQYYPNYTFEYYSETKSELNYLLLIEPCQIWNDEIEEYDKYIAPSPLWKTYLKKKSSSTKLIVAGFNPWIDDNNYLYLFNLPDDLEVFLQKAKTAEDEDAFPFTKEKRKEWKNDPRLWLRGMNLEDKLEQFFKGHGTESVVSAVAELTSNINSLRTTILENQKYNLVKSKEDKLKKYIQEDWQLFYTRWQYYYSLWQYVPFEAKMKKCHECLPQIEDFVQQKIPLFSTSSTTKELNRLIELYELILKQIQEPLQKIENTYLPDDKKIKNTVH